MFCNCLFFGGGGGGESKPRKEESAFILEFLYFIIFSPFKILTFLGFKSLDFRWDSIH